MTKKEMLENQLEDLGNETDKRLEYRRKQTKILEQQYELLFEYSKKPRADIPKASEVMLEICNFLIKNYR